jgi:hypothetical protein
MEDIKITRTTKTEEEAALAYNQAASEFHGQFSCLNTIQRS